MKIYVAEDYQSMSRKAANIVSAQVILNPASVLGLATGSTPVGMYKQLIDWYNKGDLDFDQVKSVNLDEYVGLAPDHPQSYRYFMQTNFFDHINIDPAATNVPQGLAADPAAECARYNQVIRGLGGIDIQVLGMGHNGHIGFNEPGEAITMGIKSIMQARQILVVVSGEDKAAIVKTAFTGPVTPLVPASILQMHPNVVLVGDRAALSKL